MDEGLRTGIHRIKKLRDSLHRRVNVYSALGTLDDKGTASALGALQRAPAPGRKMQKIGFILFWIPEPFGVTVAAGIPMILAGKYLDKVYNGATISDIGHETKNFVSNVIDIKDKMK